MLQYFTAGDCSQSSSGNSTTWTSPVFYLQVPDNRGPTPAIPATAADELTIHTMAKLSDVTLTAGTPVSLVWADASGLQQWNYVQAYMGTATDGFQANLHADAALPLGDTALGYLQIAKQVQNTTPDDNTQEYYFALYYSANAAGPFTERVQLTPNNTLGICSIDQANDVFDIRMGNIATIRDLSAGCSW